MATSTAKQLQADLERTERAVLEAAVAMHHDPALSGGTLSDLHRAVEAMLRARQAATAAPPPERSEVDDDARQVHRPRCCNDPAPTASWGLGTDETCFITVWCTNCNTDLVSLDPPSSPTTAPYLGPYRYAGRTEPWMRAVFGGVDVAELRDLDPDLAQELAQLDEDLADAQCQIGASDVDDDGRSRHLAQLRQRLGLLAQDLTGRARDWYDG